MKKGSLTKGAAVITLRYAIGFVLIGALWEAASRVAGESLLPSPVATALLFFSSLANPAYLAHVFVSLKRLCLGLITGAVPALAFGILFGHWKKADFLGAPLIYITFPLPKIVLLPVFFLFLGLGDASRVLLIALTTGYQMVVFVRAAAMRLDPVYESAIRFMGATRWERIKYVYLPAALPSFLTSLKVACGTAVAVLFLAESFATTSGLGYLIMDAWGVGDTLQMFNGILGMSAIGLLFYGAVWCAEVLFTPWTRKRGKC